MPPMIVTASHARRRRYNRKARGKRLAAAGHAELSPEDRASVSEAEENLLPVCVNKTIYCSYTSNHLPSCSCPSCPSCSKKRGTDGTLVVHTWQFQTTSPAWFFYIKNIHFSLNSCRCHQKCSIGRMLGPSTLHPARSESMKQRWQLNGSSRMSNCTLSF